MSSTQKCTYICLLALLPLSLLQLPTPAFGQANKFMIQGPAEQSDLLIIRDALNRPCLDVEAIARAHVVNPDMFDHVVSVKNNCSRMIKVKVCYFQTDHCKAFSLQGFQRVDTVLGTMAKVMAFRYSLFQR
ncbi:hypothetical protein ACVWWG_004732 [Bradyrhizobium sp. LB7.2]